MSDSGGGNEEISQEAIALAEKQSLSLVDSVLFHNAPVCMWHVDYSEVKKKIDGLKRQGVKDFREYIENNREEVTAYAGLIKLLEINQAALALHHAGSAEELIDKIQKVFAWETYDVFFELLVSLANGKLIPESDTVVYTLNGEKKNILMRRFFEPGVTDWSSLYLIMVDVTERKQAEEEVRHQHQLIDALVQTIPDVVFFKDMEGRNMIVNKAFANVVGLEQSEIIGKTDFEILPPNLAELCRRSDQRVISTGKPVCDEEQVLQSGGTESIYETRKSPVFDEAGNLTAIVGISRDITERYRAEEELKQHKEIVSSSTDMLAILNTDYIFLAANSAYLKAFSLVSEELIGHSASEIFGKNYFETVVKPYAQRCLSGENVSFENWIDFPGKNRAFMSIYYDPYLNDDGEVKGFVVNGRDLTQRKMEQEEKQNLQNQLRHSQKMDAVGQLAAGVAHEFNNLLVGVLSNAELLLADPDNDLPEQFKRPLESISKAATCAADLTQQLLSFARKKKPNISRFDVNAVITRSKEVLQHITGSGIILNTQLSAGTLFVNADEDDIERAITNLVLNSYDALSEDGTITIRTDLVTLDASEVTTVCNTDAGCHPGAYVALQVIDDGCGMPAEIVERIFEPFFTTKPVGKGTGLGLSTVFADITNAGGCVNVESEVGKGTTIYLHLPRAAGHAEEVMPCDQDVNRPSGSGQTILLCDDEDIVLSSTAALLEILGYKVLSADSPARAIEIAAAHGEEISLLYTDYSMPGMNGLELLEEIKKDFPGIRILITSGYGEDGAWARGDDQEKLAFIQKPASFDTLAQTLNNLLTK